MQEKFYKNLESRLFETVFNKNKFLNLSDINIFFSGATGFLGKWMLKSLEYIAIKEKIGISVTILTRNRDNIGSITKEFSNLHLDFLIDDISNIQIKKNNYDIIFHFAASSSYEDNLDKLKVSDTIINGTANIIKNSEKLNIRNIVFLSSGAVYGKNCKKYDGWKETDNDSPDVLDERSTYGLSKKCSENLLIDWARRNKANLLVLRGFTFGVISENKKSHFAFDNFIKKRVNKEDITMNSTGQSKRNYMHPLDLCNWIFLSLPLRKINILNCGSKENISLINLAKKVASLSIEGLSSVRYIKGRDHYNENYIPNLRKCHKLGYQERISLDEQIKYSIYHFLRKNNRNGKSNSF